MAVAPEGGMEIGGIGESAEEGNAIRIRKGGGSPPLEEADRPRPRTIREDPGSPAGEGPDEIPTTHRIRCKIGTRPRLLLPEMFGMKAHPLETSEDRPPLGEGAPQGGAREKETIPPTQGAGGPKGRHQGGLPVLHEKVQDHLPDSGLKVEAALLHLEPEGL